MRMSRCQRPSERVGQSGDLRENRSVLFLGRGEGREINTFVSSAGDALQDGFPV